MVSETAGRDGSPAVAAAKKRLSFWLTTLGLTVVLLALAYPGWTTNDTLGWLLQVRRNDIVDVQPPGAPLLLAIFDPIWPGPYGLVVFNLVLLCVGLMAFWRSHLKTVLAALASSIGVLAYPAVLTILPVAWRDITGLAITVLTLALAVRLWSIERANAARRRRVLLWLAIFALCFAGALFRSNHAAGALPIVALPLYPVFRRLITRSRLLSAASAVAAAFIVIASASVFAFMISAAISRPVYSMQAWKLYRLTQMSVALEENLLPAELYPGVGLPELQAFLDASKSPYREIFWTAYARANNALLPVITKSEDYRILSAAFANAVLEHPTAFAAVTLREVLSYLDWRSVPGGSHYVKRQPTGTFKARSPDGVELALDINWPTAVPWLSKAILSSAARLLQPSFVRNPLPIMSVAGAVAIMALIWRLPSTPLVLVTALSAVTHFLGVIWIAALFDFRFGHQSIAFSVIAILLFVIDLARHFRRRQGPAQAQHSVI